VVYAFKVKMQDKAKNNTISNVSNISVWLSNKLSGNGMHWIFVSQRLVVQEMISREIENAHRALTKNNFPF
jgi:hypothetical protein